jgi:hypothetical protein
LRALWLSVAQVGEEEGRLVSAVRSARTRIIGPVLALRAQGHRFRIVNPAHSLQRATQLIDESDVVVFGKPFAAGESGDFSVTLSAYAEMLNRLRGRGVRVVVDVGDAFFDAPGFADLYRAHPPDAYVAPSREMARLVRERLGLEAHVVPDCFEGLPGEPVSPVPSRMPRLFSILNRALPAATGGWRATLLWNGDPPDVPALHGSLKHLAGASRWFPIKLLCIEVDPGGMRGIPAACAALGGDVGAELVPLTREATSRAFRACDLVWLPHDHAAERTRARGAGFLVEALRAGRFPVVSGVPAYGELAQYACVDDDPSRGLAWVFSHPARALERTLRGQRHVSDAFSAPAVARGWLAALEPAG